MSLVNFSDLANSASNGSEIRAWLVWLFPLLRVCFYVTVAIAAVWLARTLFEWIGFKLSNLTLEGRLETDRADAEYDIQQEESINRDWNKAMRRNFETGRARKPEVSKAELEKIRRRVLFGE